MNFKIDTVQRECLATGQGHAGAHPVSDGLQDEAEGVCHARRPLGWANTIVFAVCGPGCVACSTAWQA